MGFPMTAPQTAPLQQEGIQGAPPQKKKPFPAHAGALKASAMFRKGAAKKKAPLPPMAPPPGAMPGPGF